MRPKIHAMHMLFALCLNNVNNPTVDGHWADTTATDAYRQEKDHVHTAYETFFQTFQSNQMDV